MRRTEWAWAAHLLTACNLFFGFWAVVQVTIGNFPAACWLIIIASICDGLDGKLARYAKGASEIGHEFDSLADVVSFGVAPAVLLYFTSFYKLGVAGLFLASLPLFFGVARLARFSGVAAASTKSGYLGLPIPMQANTLATFLIFNFALWGHLALEVLLIPLIVFLCLLMVSQVPYEAWPRFTFRDTGKNLVKLIVLFTGILLLTLNPSVLFFPLMLIYVFEGVAISLLGFKPQVDELKEALEEERLV